MTKIQLTFTDKEIENLQAKADFFGYDVPRYLKFLISKIVEEEIIRKKLNQV